MLVLTRKIGQELLIGDDVRIMVTDIDAARGVVRLGITAPREIPIMREELLQDTHPPLVSKEEPCKLSDESATGLDHD